MNSVEKSSMMDLAPPRRAHGNLYLRLAWRNIWRNKRRSLLLIASVVVAVFIAVVFSSIRYGKDEYMVHVTVGLSGGHLQIHGVQFWEKHSLDQSMQMPEEEIDSLRIIPHVLRVAPRLETISLVSHSMATKIASVVGIDPLREDQMTGLAKRVVAGEYLSPQSTGALVSEGLAHLLHVGTGDSIVVYGQGYQGVTAAAIVLVQGIVHYPLPEMNNSMVYLTLNSARQLYSAEGRLTSVAILLDESSALQQTELTIRRNVDASKEVMTWKEMMPELVQGIDLNDGGTVLMLLILYVVIGFGIFGTVMMMTVERTREFGILVSIGMNRWKLILITVLESILVSSVGFVAGVLAAIPPVYYFYFHPLRLGGNYGQAMLAYGFEPILPVSIDPIIFIIQGLTVLGLGIISSCYPLLVIRSLRPVSAMRG